MPREIKPKRTKAEQAQYDRYIARRRERAHERRAAENAQAIADAVVDLEAVTAAVEIATADTPEEAAQIKRSKSAAKAGAQTPTAMGKARDNLTAAFDLMGGVNALVIWGRKNQTEFYRIWARLIPKEAVEPTTAMPLEDLLAQLATKSEKTVATAAYEIGEEVLAAAKAQVDVEDARAMFVRPDKETLN